MKQNTLSVENYSRKVYQTKDHVDEILKDEYFNPFKRRVSVNDVITVRNPDMHELIITQVEPFVKAEYYNNFEERISALETVVAGLSRRANNTAA